MATKQQGLTLLIGVLIATVFIVMMGRSGDFNDLRVSQKRDMELIRKELHNLLQSSKPVIHASSIPNALPVPNVDPMKTCTDEVVWTEPKLKRVQHVLNREEEAAAMALECIRIVPDIFTPEQGEISYKICLHDDASDPAISANLRKGRIYEQKNLQYVAQQLVKNPNSGFIDIGANMGLFSLLVAKLGHPVIAIDPRPENILRLRNALIGEPYASKVTILQNALSDVRTRMYLMTTRRQQGHTTVVCKDKCITTGGGICNNATVDSIYMNDLTVLVKSLNFKQAIIKMDIEAHEPRALAVSDELFKLVDVRMLLMEWSFYRHNTIPERVNMARGLVTSMREKHFVPVDPGNDRRLPEDWTLWPVDVAWVKTS